MHAWMATTGQFYAAQLQSSRSPHFPGETGSVTGYFFHFPARCKSTSTTMCPQKVSQEHFQLHIKRKMCRCRKHEFSGPVSKQRKKCTNNFATAWHVMHNTPRDTQGLWINYVKIQAIQYVNDIVVGYAVGRAYQPSRMRLNCSDSS